MASIAPRLNIIRAENKIERGTPSTEFSGVNDEYTMARLTSFLNIAKENFPDLIATSIKEINGGQHISLKFSGQIDHLHNFLNKIGLDKAAEEVAELALSQSRKDGFRY